MQATNTTPYSIGLSNGANPSGSQRRARKGATSSFLNYNLYTNSGRTRPWTTTTQVGSCTGGAGSCVLGTGTGLSSEHHGLWHRPGHRAIPAAGTFTDTVVVTLTF